ncbi:hypothetical protein F4808DRAFT_425127 [Astrocystis sublimbata]|nr:hypothetical protein F4808DRAFT_425127 [Astrocystis sublimbata]
MAAKQSSDELALIRPDEGLWPAIRVVNQHFDIYPDRDCFHRVFHSRRLSVHNPDQLPILHRVTKLRVYPERDYGSSPDMDFAHVRPVSPRVPLELATRLPHLRELDCPWLWERFPIAYSSQTLRKFARVWEGPWRDARVEFGRCVRDVMPLLPSTLKKACVYFWHPNSYRNETDQAGQMPDLVGAASSNDGFGGMDPVSLGLRDLGSRLEELDVRAMITPDLFGSDDSLPWPRMQHLSVEFHPCAPDGSWYFSGPRGEDPHPRGFAITEEEHYPPGVETAEETHNLWSREEDEYGYNEDEDDIFSDCQPDVFRTRPIAERINPLLLAFAESLQQQKMPALKDAELFTWLNWRPSKVRAHEYEGCDDAPPCDEYATIMFRWGVRYDAPQGDGKGKVTWQVSEDWRPRDEVIKAFEDLVGGNREQVEWKAVEYVEEREQDHAIFI